MKYAKVKNNDIEITVYDAPRCNKIVVDGAYKNENGKWNWFERRFQTIESALSYYNKKLNKVAELYKLRSDEILNKRRGA